MKFSKENIEIDGKEYTLFLNRKGIVAWEKFCSNEAKKIKEAPEKIKAISESLTNVVIDNDTNPFEDAQSKEMLKIVEESEEATKTIYRRLYWIMLYENYKFSVAESDALYDKACEEYGVEQVNALADQIMEDANTNKVEDKPTKKLPALRPRK